MIKKLSLLPEKKKIIAIDPVTPDPDLITNAGKIIQNDGVVIFPAQCLYGVGANALSQKAIRKVFDLKQRPLTNPLLVLISDKEMLVDLVTTISEPARKLIKAFWPGNLTLIFNARNDIPQILTANTGKIGIRIPAHPVARALVKKTNHPITGTSANLSGSNGCNQISQLDSAVINPADLVLDAGTLKGGTGSTIVDTTASTLHILREGQILSADIHQILKN